MDKKKRGTGTGMKKKRNEEYKNAKYFWLFIAPWVIGFLAFTQDILACIKKYVCVHYRVCAFEYGIFYSPGSTVEQRFTGKQGLSRNLLPADYLYRSCNVYYMDLSV